MNLNSYQFTMSFRTQGEEFMKIGASHGESRRYILQDPAEFAPRNQSDGTESGQSWTNLVRRIAPQLAMDWFSDYPKKPFPQWLEQDLGFSSEGVARLLEDFSSMELDRHEVVPSIIRNPEHLGEIVPLLESPLAASVLAALAEKGVTGTEVPYAAMGGMLIEIATPSAWMGAWGTGFGSRCQVWFEIRRNNLGIEHCVVYTNLLVNTRPLVEGMVRELFDSIGIGRWCQTLLYLGETPFPSGIMSFGRSMAMESLPLNSYPQPLAWAENFGLTSSLLGNGAFGDLSVNFATFPLVLRLGYAIQALPTQELTDALSVAIDTLVNTSTIVEDGFRSSRGPDAEAPFDAVFMSEFGFLSENPGRIDGYARWIPEPLLGSLYNRTHENYALSGQGVGTREEQRNALEWIANNGAGSEVASAINTLAYSFLIPAREFDEAKFYLTKAVSMDVLYESTNAMANLGGMFIADGDLQAAEEVLLKALEQPDRFAEGEANVLLARIYRSQGNREKSIECYQRAMRSENAKYVEIAKQECEGEIVEKESAPTRLAKFCGTCGSAFENTSAKFCGHCGHPRGA
jgi:tetratricopeptide (TPR) repeat protein